MLGKLKNTIQNKIDSTKKPESKDRTAKTDQLSELKRCARDPSYFARNFVYIKNKDVGKMKFNLWDFQEKMLKDFQTNQHNIVLKARQLGITELISTYVLWYTLFQRDKNVVIISKNRRAAAELVKRIKYAYKKLPDWLKIAKITSDNVFSLSFDNDSVIFADATTETAGRGEACSLFIIDEAAFIDVLEELWGSVFPSLGKHGRCIISSTPNGAGGKYHELFVGAPQNGLNPIRLNWNVEPTRDQNWYEKMLASIGPRRFAIEYGCDFAVSGDTVVDGADIQRHELNVIEPEAMVGPAHNVWVWKDFNPGDRWCLSADCARGDGEDFSTFIIRNVDTKEIAAEFKGKIKVDRFAELICAWGYNYGSCLVVVENNSFGLAVLMKIIELKYPNLYYEEKGTHTYTQGYVDWDYDDVVPGFTTNQITKYLCVEKLEEAFRLNNVVTYSKRMIQELRSFIYENGKPKARKGNNDDLVMALAINLFVSSLVFGSKEKDIEMTYKLLHNVRRQSNELNFRIPGEDGFSQNNNAFLPNKPQNPYTIQFKDQQIDFQQVLYGKPKQIPTEEMKKANVGIIYIGTLK